MKSILIITTLLISALAFAQEKQPPEPKAERQSTEQSQSSGNSQAKTIIDLSIVLENRIVPPLDWTEHALKDKKGMCKVHHQTLRMATVPIRYGLMPGPPYPKKTEQKLFPNALTSIEPGCLVMPVKEALVLQCQKCIEAKTKWVESHQNDNK